ncbi:FGGY-family carbohydrate kinase, partial [Mycoplasmopsis bovis]|uniref:FGGY-family carbohydrate kinase n=1 Tax=Mycoplasmopsis bovis TaxID=28903 RepID=UPI003D2E3DB4
MCSLFVRATLEAIAYQANDVVSAMGKDMNDPIKIFKVDGGASNNKFMMQFQSNISQSKVIKPVKTDEIKEKNELQSQIEKIESELNSNVSLSD